MQPYDLVSWELFISKTTYGDQSYKHLDCRFRYDGTVVTFVVTCLLEVTADYPSGSVASDVAVGVKLEAM